MADQEPRFWKALITHRHAYVTCLGCVVSFIRLWLDSRESLDYAQARLFDQCFSSFICLIVDIDISWNEIQESLDYALASAGLGCVILFI